MLDYDPFAYRTQDDPYPVYRRMRDEAPLYFSQRHGFWALSRYADVHHALKDGATFSSGRLLLEDVSEVALPMIVGMDDPDHGRVRDLLKHRWTRRRVWALEAPVRALARGFLERFASSGRVDVMTEYAGLLPMAVISELLAVPERDRAWLQERADTLLTREDEVEALPETSKQAFRDIHAYFDARIAERGRDPGDDMLGVLIAARRDGLLSHPELLGFCFLLIIAGNETTMKLIGNLVWCLAEDPAARARLAAEPARIPRAIEEALRHDAPVQMRPRTLTRDAELHGRKLREGETVALLLASANRDERQFTDPDRFDIERDASGHLALGIGAHFCLGASLARLEARIALEELLARIPEWEIETSGARRIHTPSVRGFTHLPIRF